MAVFTGSCWLFGCRLFRLSAIPFLGSIDEDLDIFASIVDAVSGGLLAVVYDM